MKIELDQNLSGKNRIFAYSRAGIRINETLYQSSVIVTPDTIIDDWSARHFTDLSVQALSILFELKPEVLLLGTGPTLHFPSDDIMCALNDSGIGVEYMDTGAACRAYNFLMGEDRHVAAALLPLAL